MKYTFMVCGVVTPFYRVYVNCLEVTERHLPLRRQYITVNNVNLKLMQENYNYKLTRGCVCFF